MKKTYERAHFFGYDELLTFLLSTVHFPVSMNYFDALFALTPVRIERFGEHQRILLEGMSGVCDVQVGFHPHASIRSLFMNVWPQSFELVHEPLQTNELKKYALDARQTYTVQVLGGCFTQFWERVADAARAQFGADVTAWPEPLNFARVVRNSFAHGNRIHFTNAGAAAVEWRSLTFSPADNGREVVFSAMGLADFVILIEDVSAVVS